MLDQRITTVPIQSATQDTYLLTWIEAFMIDRKAQNLAAGSIRFYRQKLTQFARFCESQALTRIDQINPAFIRAYLLALETTGHNPGGIHAGYRSLKAFLLWFEFEADLEGWKNPIRRVKAPKVFIEPLEPVELDEVRSLLDTCQRGTFLGDRDYAILLTLLDSGARAGELLRMDRADLNPETGAIVIRKGKGRKPRSIFVGIKTLQGIAEYLKTRQDDLSALWVTDDTSRGTVLERLTYNGLRAIISRRSEQAKIRTPSIHDFRRAFALNFLRNNPGEIYSLQKLMGHTSLYVLRRYLAQTDQDIMAAHRRGGPVDHSLLAGAPDLADTNAAIDQIIDALQLLRQERAEQIDHIPVK